MGILLGGRPGGHMKKEIDIRVDNEQIEVP